MIKISRSFRKPDDDGSTTVEILKK